MDKIFYPLAKFEHYVCYFDLSFIRQLSVGIVVKTCYFFFLTEVLPIIGTKYLYLT